MNPKVEISIKTLGFSLWWAWVWVVLFSDSIIPVGVTIQIAWIIYLGFASAALGILALITNRVGRAIWETPSAGIVFPIICSIGTIVCAMTNNVFVIYIGAAIIGVGSSGWLLDCIGYLSTIPKAKAGACMAWSLLCAVIIFFLLVERPLFIGYILIAALPLCSIPLARIRPVFGAKSDQEARSQNSQIFPKPFWSLCVVMLVYTAAFGMFKGYTARDAAVGLDYFIMLGIGIVSLLLVILHTHFSQNINSDSGYRIPLPFFAVGLAILMVGDLRMASPAAIFVMMGWACFNILGWTAMSGIIPRSTKPSLLVAVSGFFWQFGTFIGAVICELAYIAPSSVTYSYLPLLIIVTLVVVTSIDFVSGSGNNGQNKLSSPHDDADKNDHVAKVQPAARIEARPSVASSEQSTQDPATARFDSVISEICANCELSEREEEVLRILARGRNLPQVSKEMSISRNTAATHAQHIYQKVGVHSRQELLDYVDGELAKQK